MVFSKNEEELIIRLSDLLNELLIILEQIGEDTNKSYRFLKKVGNILNSKDPKGMRNVKQHLMMDFRVIEDRQLEGKGLDEILDKVYRCASDNNIFHH